MLPTITSYEHIWNLLQKHLSRALSRRLWKIFSWNALNCRCGMCVTQGHHKQILNLTYVGAILRLANKTSPCISWPWSPWGHVSELELKKTWDQQAILGEMPDWNYKAYLAAADHVLFEVMGSSWEEETPPGVNEEVRAPWANCDRKTRYKLKPSLIHPHASESTELTQIPRGFDYNGEWKGLEFCEFGEHIP